MITITDSDIDVLEEETGLVFDSSRREVLKSYADVQACPGSGKTTLVGAKLILLAKKWQYKHRGVCVLSHTNVAKDEIVQLLESHPQGRLLLRYPHYIGTIQEFVNKFIALPFIRSKGWNISEIVSDDDFAFLANSLRWKSFKDRSRKKQYNFAYYIRSNKIHLKDMAIVLDDEKLVLSPKFIDKVKALVCTSEHTGVKKYFSKKRKELIDKGYYTYQEMFEFSKHTLRDTAGLKSGIRFRFPYAFVDEMQDTSQVQDDVINSIFNHDNCQMQRFGDPDQAIFEGTEAVNTSYNDATHEAVCSSHRFSQSIANLASGLSHKGLTIESLKSSDNKFPHTIFLVDAESRYSAITAFAELCGSHLPSDCNHSIKAVGAVGKRTPSNLAIPHYFPEFDKSKSPRNFKPEKFIHYFAHGSKTGDSHSAEHYRLVLEGVTRCARLDGKKLSMPDGTERPYTIDSLKRYLRGADSLREFNELYLNILDGGLRDSDQWRGDCRRLLDLAGLQIDTRDAHTFTDYERVRAIQTETVNNHKNTLTYKVEDRNIDVEIATIHSVKGETHDATLVLETKFRQSHDIQSLLDHILKIQMQRVTAVQKKKFMKQLYVAMTRPQYLLCLAVDKSRITDEQIERARGLGWQISDLT